MPDPTTDLTQAILHVASATRSLSLQADRYDTEIQELRDEIVKVAEIGERLARVVEAIIDEGEFSVKVAGDRSEVCGVPMPTAFPRSGYCGLAHGHVGPHLAHGFTW